MDNLNIESTIEERHDCYRGPYPLVEHLLENQNLGREQRPAVATHDGVVALLVTDKVHVATQTTWRQALAVECRILVKATGDTVQLVLRLEQVTWGARGGLGDQVGIAARAREGDLEENQEQEGNDDELGPLHLLVGK